MLAIRLQRVGRKGLPQYRVVVQNSQVSPKSGKVIEFLGHYNPHTKEVKIEKEVAQKFLDNGAQPSQRAAKLLKEQGVKLPKWFAFDDKGERKTRNPEKLRKNQPAEEKAEEKAEEPEAPAAEPETKTEEATEEKPTEAEEKSETPAEEQKEEKPEETPAEESSDEKSKDSEK